jgi:F1F0 ATPase subunit 2
MGPRDVLVLILAMAWGSIIGLFYFWGLWRTLHFVQGKTRARLWLVMSFLVRTSAAMAGFWLVIREDVTAFFFTFGGFFIMRLILTRKFGELKQGASHAN